MANSLAESLAHFSKQIYDQALIANGADSDLIMSPFSISVALSMLYAGSNGNTKDQLKKLLFDQYRKDDSQLHANFSEIIGVFNSENKSYQLHVANRLYPNVHFVQKLLPEYVESLAKFYRSDLKAVDFGQAEQACTEINGWAKEKTRGKIDSVLSPDCVNSDTKLVIINAVYFKGNWLQPFDKDLTQEQKFDQKPNQSTMVDMMRCSGTSFPYMETDQFQLLGMPYEGSDVSMYFFLPHNRYGLTELEQSLKSSDLLKVIKECKSTEIMTVAIPKFKLETFIGLNEILLKLGMTDMFAARVADLSNINGEKTLFVSNVIHKAFIEVNEEGSEAAAVTAIIACECAMIIEEKNPIHFIANHPFMYAIFHEKLQTFLFVGRYYGK